MDHFGLPSAVRAGCERQRNLSAGESKTRIRKQIAGTIEAPGLLKLVPVDEIAQHCNEYLHELLPRYAASPTGTCHRHKKK
jgi:hypothetical protein